MKMTLHFFVLVALLGAGISAHGQDDANPSLEKVRAMPDDTAKVFGWIKLSEFALKESFEKGREYADSAFVLSEKIEFNKGIYGAYEQMGRAESYLGNFKAAFDDYEKAYKYYKTSGEKVREAAVLNRMGETKRSMDEYEESLKYLQASIKIYEEHGNANEMGSGYISIGILHAVRGDEVEAEKYFLQAVESFKSVDNKDREYLTLLNLGALYNEMREFEKAIKVLTQASDYFKANGPEIRLGVAYFNLGVANFELEKLKESKTAYLKGLEIFERLGDKFRINGAIMGLSRIDFKLGNTDFALVNAERALAGFVEVGSLSQQIVAFDHISKIFETKKDYKKALEYRYLYEEMNDSVHNQETEARIAELEEKYQSEVKDQQLAQTRAELELSELILQKQQNQKFAFMGVAAFILIILVLLFNQFRIKKRTNDTLREKNAIIEKSLGEKEVLLKEIHHRVKNNLQFISSMLNLQARHVKDEHALAVLLESKTRIHSMALVHQKLYQEDNLTGVSMQEYLNNLLDSLQHFYKIQKETIKVVTSIDAMLLDIDTAMPIGLLVNEMITNCFKYAFDANQVGLVNISLVEKGGNLELIVQDNGRGFTEQVEQVSADRFGFKLMKSLADKLGGTLEIDTTDGVLITLNITNYKKV